MRPEDEELRFLAQQRRSLVQRRANAFVEMHVLLDRYWPAIQGIPEVIDGKAHVERIFAKTWPQMALKFLRHVSTPAQALRLGEAGLIELSRRERLALGTRRIRLILRAAELAPKIPEPLVPHYDLSTREQSLLRQGQSILSGFSGAG